MFADKYLEKNNNRPLIETPPSANCGIIIVIPCFMEPDILLTLDSLLACDLPKQNVEVIVLINHSEIAEPEVKSYNLSTKLTIDNWIRKNPTEKIDFYARGPVELPKKWAGVGLARKSGMDEAARRFSLLGKPEGIIVGFDADSLVEKNYFIEIENHFRQHPKDAGATISFQHQTAGVESHLLKGILLYEKYLTYYKHALEFAGFPHAMYTVGSAFAVTAEAYIKRGGMNRKKAGEDFYFLQNLVQVGRVGEITSTRVFPSARVSDRVPFGTGALMNKWMNGEDDLTKTYSFRAFQDLKLFFDCVERFFKINETEFEQLLSDLPESIQEFVVQDNFWKELNGLNQNCATLATFQIRFFYLFNAFKILKFLNFAHEQFYEKVDMEQQVLKLRVAKLPLSIPILKSR